MARRSKRLRELSSSRMRKPQWIDVPISKTTPPTYIGVRKERHEFFLSSQCHVRGGQNRDDEHTCEIQKLYEDINGEKFAKVRWFYWPTELDGKQKMKKLPSFSSKEVVLSDEYGVIDVESLSKPCHVNLLHSTDRVPDRGPKGTLYCRWKVRRRGKELLPALQDVPQPVKKQIGDKKRENEPTTSKKRKKSPNIATTLEKKCKLPSPAKKQRVRPLHKEDTNVLQVARERLHVSAVPESLPCRQAEYDQVYSFLELRLQDRTGGCMYISGMPGTGKTATVLEVVHELQQSAADEEGGDIPVFQFIHLNGLNLTNPQQVFQVILKQLTGKTASPATAVDKLNKHFSDMDPDSEGSILLLVDELDMLWTKKQSVFYTIFEWCTWPDTPLILVAIANTMDLPERMLIGRITSRLGLTRLEFLPYNFKQLLEILSARLQDLDVFERDAMVLAARKIAAMSGDARKALDVCRRATEVAEQQGCSQVGIRHIDEVVKEMFFSLKVMAVKYASLQEKLLLQSIQSDLMKCSTEETTLEQVYSTYCNLCLVKAVMQVLSLSELSSVCSRLTNIQLLSVGKGRGIHQMLQLNIGKDDLNYGLSL